MKTLATLLSTLVVLGSINADARSMRQDFESAEITHMNIDAKSQLATERLDGSGLVYINHTQNTATLQLNRKFYCPPGRFCAQVMPAPVIITLPIKKVSEGACNSIIYVAAEDKRPVDGMYQGLRITDNKRFSESCLNTRFVDSTFVEYKTISPGFGAPVVETLSTFVAKSLKRN